MNLEKLESNLANARHTASMAHSVVIKLKEMGLPEHLDDDLGTLSTDPVSYTHLRAHET